MGEVNINVKEIMDEIRREIAREEPIPEPVSFQEVPVLGGKVKADGFSSEFLNENVSLMNQSWEIRAFRPLPGGGFKRFVKRVLRKLMKFYIEPITEDVTRFDAYSVRSVNALRDFTMQQIEENRKKDQEIIQLKSRISEIEARFASMGEKQ